jgi:hypothetical protein
MTSMSNYLQISLFAAVTAIGSLMAPAAYADKPNLMVVSDDADKDTIPRENRNFNRVLLAMMEALNVKGFTVIDETAAAMNITAPGVVRRRDVELIDIARAIPRPPIDAVVIFQIYASARQSQFTDITRLDIRIPGRIINVHTGQFLAAFEVAGLDLPPLPRGCDRECLLERTGDSARPIAAALGDALAEKLSAFDVSRGGPPPEALVGPGCRGTLSTYFVVFEGFTSQMTTQAEEYMAAFRCFTGMRPVRSSPSLAEYTYDTSEDMARLNRNLRVMLDHMGIVGQIQVAGNTLKVVRVPGRR